MSPIFCALRCRQPLAHTLYCWDTRVLGWPHRSHGPAGSPGAGSDIRCRGGSFLHLANDVLLCLCRIFRIRQFCRSSSLSVFLIGVRCVYIRGVFLEKLPKGRQARKGVGATAEGFLQADGESFSQASATPSKTLSPGTLLCQESVTALASASLTAPWGEATSVTAGMGMEVWVSGHPGGGSGSAGHGQRFVSAALPRREEDEDALEASALNGSFQGSSSPEFFDRCHTPRYRSPPNSPGGSGRRGGHRLPPPRRRQPGWRRHHPQRGGPGPRLPPAQRSAAQGSGA